MTMLFMLQGCLFNAGIVAYRCEQFTILYENETVDRCMKELGYTQLLIEIVQALREEKTVDANFIIVDDNYEECDNWLFSEEGVWVLTFGTVMALVNHVLKMPEAYVQ